MLKNKRVLKVNKKKYWNAVYSNDQSLSSGKPFNKPKNFRELKAILRKIKEMKPTLDVYKKDVKECYESLDNNPIQPKQKADAAFINELETYAKSLGVSELGYAVLSPELLYKGSVAMYPNAIVLTMAMDKEEIAKSPSRETHEMIHRTYSELNTVTNEIARFIRGKGYGAHAGLSAGDLICNYPELAVKAGLGYRGRSGNLITSQFGPRVRLAVIFTSIENFELCEDNPHKWIKDFCQNCGQCIKKCPQEAIAMPEGSLDIREYKHVNSGKCATVGGCADCMKVCPFNKAPYEKIRSSFLGTQN